ncbi:hypothetical protein [Hymenobacter rubidus]|uniref:hypothetical protein n=1 Tax=Hymenobacter rubidus TaxID=1441626 RepID=UPI00191E1D0F|nr:hypothetical protein [Hymenobacter rubidus]
MAKLYLDIDGVLLTSKNTRAAPGVDAFVAFVTQQFDCYWLTTHCKGDSQSALKYLSQFLLPSTLEQLKDAVHSTNWDALKTEAIELESDFYWVDDNPFQAEIARLTTRQVADRLIVVDLSRPNELFTVQTKLQESLKTPLTSFADHLTAQYGQPDSPSRMAFEEEFAAFKHEAQQH